MGIDTALPYEIIQAMIQCFGRSFHYKDSLTEFMISAGVSRDLANRYRHEPKFVWGRHVLAELGSDEDGCLTQRRLLTNLCMLRDVPDPGLANRNDGLDALRRLKECAVQHHFELEEQKQKKSKLVDRVSRAINLAEDRAQQLEAVRAQFFEAVAMTDRQAAGYSLEDLLVKLFGLFEMDYRKPYRLPTQQIDGHAKFEGFDYLVEAKWRKDMPTEQEIAGFKQKVDGKIESTRGIFISIPGFRKEVTNRFEVPGANIIFFTGEDMAYVLEGRFDLRDALRLKVDKAAQEGRVNVSLREVLE